MSPKPRVLASMGVEVVVGGATAEELDAIRRLFAGWDAVFSRFRPDSELSRINRDPAKVVVLSRLFAYVTRAALGAAAATEGLVDPTLGLGIEAAGYDRDFTEVGDDGPLGESAPGRWRELRLSGRLLSRPPGVALDLNGVVKALAVDAALEKLSGKGFVSAGGDVATRGGAVVGLPGGGSLRLGSGGLATSGTTKRRWCRNGGVQHHLLDSHTGRPSSSHWEQVTVAAGSCVAADVAAKAAFLLSDDGPAWLDERGLPGRFLAGADVVVNRSWDEALAVAA
jgi:thiamine biosynthesis lipoprotein